MAPASGSGAQTVELRETLKCIDTLIQADADQTEKVLFDDPVVLVTIFRQFPWLAQQIVLRLLFISGPSHGKSEKQKAGKDEKMDVDVAGPTVGGLKQWMVSQGPHHKEAMHLLKEAVAVLQSVGWLQFGSDGEESENSPVLLKPTVLN